MPYFQLVSYTLSSMQSRAEPKYSGHPTMHDLKHRHESDVQISEEQIDLSKTWQLFMYISLFFQDHFQHRFCHHGWTLLQIHGRRSSSYQRSRLERSPAHRLCAPLHLGCTNLCLLEWRWSSMEHKGLQTFVLQWHSLWLWMSQISHLCFTCFFHWCSSTDAKFSLAWYFSWCHGCRNLSLESSDHRRCSSIFPQKKGNTFTKTRLKQDLHYISARQIGQNWQKLKLKMDKNANWTTKLKMDKNVKLTILKIG